MDGDILPVDFMKNAESLGANVLEAKSFDELVKCLAKAKTVNKTTLIYVETNLEKTVEGYSWWEVAISQVSDMETVKEAYKDYVKNKSEQRYYL